MEGGERGHSDSQAKQHYHSTRENANLIMASPGYNLGWMSPVGSKLGDVTTSPLPHAITAEESSWIGSLLNVGAMLGPFIGGVLLPRTGRKWGLIVSTVPIFVGWILIAAASSVEMLYAARICWGVGIGMLFTISPMYCAEIATVDARGALGSFLQTFITLGYLLVYGIGPYVSYDAVAYVGIALLAVAVVAFSFMPESPIHHLIKNDKEAAAQCLMTIRGRPREGVADELNQMVMDVQASSEKTATLADVFRGSNFKAFYISCALMFFQQFSGINAVLFYIIVIFSAAGSDLDPSVAGIIIAAVQVLASLVTPLLADRLGRRLLLLISSCGSAIGLALLGMYFLLDATKSPAVQSLGFLPLLCLVLFILTYCWGLGPLPWVVMGELLPIEVKTVATPIVTAFCWTLAFLVTRFFQPVALAVGMHVAFWLFGVCMTASFFFTFFVVPETKGRSLADIQDILAGRSPDGKGKS